MSFYVPKVDRYGRVLQPEVKELLGDRQCCLVCRETDPARYANCTKGDCYPFTYLPPEHNDGFAVPKPMVSAFELARGMRAKALRLDWEQDEERERLLKRARELERGDYAEVPNEDY